MSPRGGTCARGVRWSTVRVIDEGDPTLAHTWIPMSAPDQEVGTLLGIHMPPRIGAYGWTRVNGWSGGSPVDSLHRRQSHREATMKSAVVFASKHSTTADIAQRIAHGLRDAQPEDQDVAGGDKETQASEPPTTEPQTPGTATTDGQTPEAQSSQPRPSESQAPEPHDVVVLDLADGTPDLTPFDLVVLGTPIYAGQPLPAMRDLIRTGIPDTARLGLFVIGMVPDAEGRVRELANAYPEELRERATAVGFLGGRLRFSRMNRFERFVVTRMAKTRTDVDAIEEDALSRFVSELRS